jgi:hypothetical protein
MPKVEPHTPFGGHSVGGRFDGLTSTGMIVRAISVKFLLSMIGTTGWKFMLNWYRAYGPIA